MDEGCVIALDVGTKTIGLATSDPGRRFCFPQGTIARRGVRQDVEALARVCRERRVTAVVVGLPLDLDGHETRSTRLARQVGDALAAATGLPVAWQDERFSTLEAEDRLRAAGVGAAARRATIDAHAAAVILEDWLNARPGSNAGG
jgi:putative Holliday junction resolvase